MRLVRLVLRNLLLVPLSSLVSHRSDELDERVERREREKERVQRERERERESRERVQREAAEREKGESPKGKRFERAESAQGREERTMRE